jgi:hypothetical protein
MALSPPPPHVLFQKGFTNIDLSFQQLLNVFLNLPDYSPKQNHGQSFTTFVETYISTLAFMCC